MMITCPFFTVSPTFTLMSRITPGSGDFTPDLPVEAAAGFTTGVAGAAGADVAAGRATGLTTSLRCFFHFNFVGSTVHFYVSDVVFNISNGNFI